MLPPGHMPGMMPGPHSNGFMPGSMGTAYPPGMGMMETHMVRKPDVQPINNKCIIDCKKAMENVTHPVKNDLKKGLLSKMYYI